MIEYHLAFLSALASFAAPVVGSLIGSSSAKSTNESALSESQANRDFQLQMAKNAHQYEVEDLKAAGLNPILSTHGSGASASGGSGIPSLSVPADSGGKSAATSMQGMLAKAQLENTQADTALKQSSSVAQRAQASSAAANAALTNTQNIQQSRYTPIYNQIGSAAQSASNMIDKTKANYSRIGQEGGKLMSAVKDRFSNNASQMGSSFSNLVGTSSARIRSLFK